ncbi:unnamed protein product [Spirodela intermedia]|uniref:Uncharacterized protein n=1 Tax=Spirodela intermedia TaxID=51605 RepID=A0A7I8IDE4_SPIIN|nr:unnamed protein product [Spirodela intermedia]CAA6655641.1 unnamed protein product [Spirodela intermedia]
MGVKNLWDILESCKKILPLHHLQNKRLCVDLSCWMVQFRHACRSPACVRDKLYLQSLFHRIRAHGSIPAIKLSAYRRRWDPAAGEEQNFHIVHSLQRNRGSEFSCMIKEAKALGMAFGIPCLDGVEEAEAQCASLNLGIFDGCFTADSDIFLFGARIVYRDIILGDNGYVICYDMVDIEQKLGYGRNTLISLAVLLGSDYYQGVRGFGPETACQLVKSIGDDTILERIISGKLTFMKVTQRTKKKGKAFMCHTNNNQNSENVRNLGRECHELSDQFLEVIHAYLKPKCHSPDSEAVKRLLSHLPFRQSLLQEICETHFHWDSDKTDRYILPKIAERNLRIFANFRATSEDLGVRIPLQEMPIAYPPFAIVKERRLLGRACFEVSWQGFDRPLTSTVPADLVKSACPEMVAEFMAKKEEDRRQKRRPRPKPAEGLLALSLTEEQEKGPSDSERRDQPAALVDLSTPSPPLRLRKLAKQRGASGQLAGAIDIDSSDSSPEKADGDPSSRHSELVDATTPPPPWEGECDGKQVNGGGSEEDQRVAVIDIVDSESDASPENRRKASDQLHESVDGDLY